MEAIDARRLRLFELLEPKLGEEVAKELVLQPPAGPEVLATKADLEVLKTQILDPMDARSPEALGGMNARFGEVNGRIAQLEATSRDGWSPSAAPRGLSPAFSG